MGLWRPFRFKMQHSLTDLTRCYSLNQDRMSLIKHKSASFLLDNTTHKVVRRACSYNCVLYVSLGAGVHACVCVYIYVYMCAHAFMHAHIMYLCIQKRAYSACSHKSPRILILPLGCKVGVLKAEARRQELKGTHKLNSAACSDGHTSDWNLPPHPLEA